MAESSASRGGAIVAGTIAVLLNMALLLLIPHQPAALSAIPMRLVFVTPLNKPISRPLDSASRNATKRHPKPSTMRSTGNRESEKQLRKPAQASVSVKGHETTAPVMASTPGQASMSANTGSTPAGSARIGSVFQDTDPLQLKRKRPIAAARETVHLRLRPELSLSLLGQRKYCAYLRGLLLGTEQAREQAFTGPTTKEGVFTAMQNSGCIKD